MKKTLVLGLLLLTIIVLIGVDFNEYYFTFKINSPKELTEITKIISIDNVKNHQVWAYANDKELRKFINAGYTPEMLGHPSLEADVQIATSTHEMRDWDSYPTYETYVEMMYQFQTDYPNICQVSSIGNSVNNRELIVAKISDNVNTEEDEPEFFYTSTMHGDEVAPYVFMIRLIDYLLSNYGSDPRVDNLVNNVEIYINPLSNPDGTYHGGNEHVNGAIRYNGNGVDLNRNYPDFSAGDHPDGNAWQPETIAMMDFASSHNFVLSTNMHSGSELVNYPWDTIPDLHPDDTWWRGVAHEYADAVHAVSPSDYMDGFDDGITNGYAWYTMDGGRQDYMNYYQACREMTLELSDVKLLPPSDLPTYWNYNQESFLLYMEEALYGIRGIVTDEDGNPLAATITVQDHDHLNTEVHTDPDVGDYHRFIANGNWNIIVSATGYTSQMVENVAVNWHETTTLNFTLHPQEMITVTGLVSNGETQEPLVDVRIELADSEIIAYTNEDGSFTISDIPAGIYNFILSKEGFASIMETITVSNENNYLEFSLFPSTAESFEGGVFIDDWSFAGNADWLITSNDSFDGSHSAQSGDIDDDQSSQLIITIDVTEAGNISFYRKISSESDYDFLRFYIDDTENGAWSGEGDWQQFSYNVNTGTHTFKWSYEKDFSVSNGSDCGWIDYITFPPQNTGNNEDCLPQNSTRLLGNYPNPFYVNSKLRTSGTNIKFYLSQPDDVTLNIYNIKGQKIRTLVEKYEKSGSHSIYWNGKNEHDQQLGSGVYLYKLNTGKSNLNSKLLIIK